MERVQRGIEKRAERERKIADMQRDQRLRLNDIAFSKLTKALGAEVANAIQISGFSPDRTEGNLSTKAFKAGNKKFVLSYDKHSRIFSFNETK
jgi:hypothetical protein